MKETAKYSRESKLPQNVYKATHITVKRQKIDFKKAGKDLFAAYVENGAQQSLGKREGTIISQITANLFLHARK